MQRIRKSPQPNRTHTDISRSAHLASHPRRACLELLRVSLQKGKGLCSRCCGNRVWEERERETAWVVVGGWKTLFNMDSGIAHRAGSQTFKSACLDGRPATRDSGWRRPGVLANGNLRPIESNQTPAKESRSWPRAKPRLLAAIAFCMLTCGGEGVWNRGRQASPFRRFKSEVTKTHGAFCLLSPSSSSEYGAGQPEGPNPVLVPGAIQSVGCKLLQLRQIIGNLQQTRGTD
ncbi:hypothetical protein E2320_017238 [Naja naja]|nr:hypothetical protein E2320_017238 [Naja naja]